MSVRHRKEILKEVYTDFKEYGFPKNITFEGYLSITGKGPLRRAIKKNYKTWPRLIKGLEMTYPDVFSGVQEQAEEPEQDPLAALGKASVSADDTEKSDG